MSICIYIYRHVSTLLSWDIWYNPCKYCDIVYMYICVLHLWVGLIEIHGYIPCSFCWMLVYNGYIHIRKFMGISWGYNYNHILGDLDSFSSGLKKPSCLLGYNPYVASQAVLSGHGADSWRNPYVIALQFVAPLGYLAARQCFHGIQKDTVLL